jgi:hypothetical protein
MYYILYTHSSALLYKLRNVGFLNLGQQLTFFKIFVVINLPTGVFLHKKKYATKLVLSLKYQTLNMQATYESSISCFDGKLL